MTMMERWAKESEDLIHHNGKPGKTRRAFHSLKKRVLSAERIKEVNAHTLRHTCASWLVGLGVSVAKVAEYISTTEEVVRKHYAHFSPGFYQDVVDAWKLRPHAEKKVAEAAEKRMVRAARRKF
nr:site-specific integrase [Rhizobium laguerreae]